MKKLIPGVLIWMLLFSCSKDRVLDDGQVTVVSDTNRMLILKIDYQSFVFEGGTELYFDSNIESDTIPMDIIYVEPGDFGGITLIHAPTSDSIFDGTIIWSGLGEQTYPPVLESPDFFDQSEIVSENPQFEDVQYIQPYLDPSTIGGTNIQGVWASISGLEPVHFYMEQGALVALLTYTPSVGIGDPAEWDYYLMFYL